MNKKRKLLVTSLIIIITIVCIFLGNKTRYNNRMIITQLNGEGDGYILKTSESNLIIIDGGTKNDVERIKQIINESEHKRVLAWFITSPEEDKAGALCEILNTESDVPIDQIYFSFIDYGEWYQNSKAESDEINNIIDNLNIFFSDKNRGKLIELGRRTMYKFDNLYITALEVKNEQEFDNTDIANQNVILRVDNTFKSAVFLGDIGEEKGDYFMKNDQDQFDCNLLQISSDNLGNAGNEIFKAIEPEYVLISDDTIPNFVESENVYTKQAKEKTLEIW